MASFTAREPAVISGVTTGLGLAVLIEPLQDILLELHASPRLAAALVKLMLFALPVLAAWWTRGRTVSPAVHEEVVKAALALPPDSTAVQVNTALKAAENKA